MELKKIYEKLKSKHNLPDYEKLNIIFDIESIDDDSELILFNIKKKMHEKIKAYCEIIENIVQPETNLRDLYESRYLSDKIKESAYSLYKKLMIIIRKSNLVSIENNEKDIAEFINETYKKYNKFKKPLSEHIEELERTWEKDTNIKKDLSYFG